MSSNYPLPAFSFEVRIVEPGDSAAAGFSEVSGLDAQSEIVTLPEGGDNRFVHRLPGVVKHSNLVMKRGLMLVRSGLFEWCKSTLESDLETPLQPKTISVSLLDHKQVPLMSWHLDGALPLKWRIASFNANEAEIAVETLEFTYQGLERRVPRATPPLGMFDPGA